MAVAWQSRRGKLLILLARDVTICQPKTGFLIRILPCRCADVGVASSNLVPTLDRRRAAR